MENLGGCKGARIFDAALRRTTDTDPPIRSADVSHPDSTRKPQRLRGKARAAATRPSTAPELAEARTSLASCSCWMGLEGADATFIARSTESKIRSGAYFALAPQHLDRQGEEAEAVQ